MEDLKLDIDSRYSTYSLSIVLHLIHNNEEFKNLWIEKYPSTESYANNFFKNENCGCRPSLVTMYKRDRFNADGSQNLDGFVFAIPATEGHYKDFLASLQQKNAKFSHFNTLQLNDKIILTFF